MEEHTEDAKEEEETHRYPVRSTTPSLYPHFIYRSVGPDCRVGELDSQLLPLCPAASVPILS